ncbi:MAG TPA: ABC transporter permease [Pedococcus sp.]
MRAVLTIAAKDLRQRLRDRSALVLGVLAPLAVAWLISAAFGGVQTFRMDVVLVDLDRGPVAQSFGAFLRGPELDRLLTVRTAASEAAARAEVADGRADAAFVVPAGYSATVTSGEVATLGVLGSVDSSVASEVARSLAASFGAHLEAVRLSVGTALSAGADPAEVQRLAGAAAEAPPTLTVTARSAGTEPVSAISYYAPSMAVFFVLFAISFGARGWFLERQAGTLERLSAAPVPAWAVLLGKSAATFVYAAASLGTVAVVTTTVFGARWGPPLAVAALVVAVGLLVVGLTAFVIGASRSERQADGLASILTFALVLLGGNFIFVSAAPPLLRTLSLATPNGWVLRAFTDLAGGAGASAALLPVAVVLGWALAGGLAGVLLLRRRTP